MSDKPAAPDFLADEGKRIWSEIVDIYDLRPDELLTLEDICAASDLILDLRHEWIALGRPTMTTGSMGQEVEHPLIGSIDKAQKSRNQMWRQLKLPDIDGEAGAAVNQQRDAANTKWATGKGRGA